MNFPDAPASVNLELTNYCNLKCKFCLNPKPGFRVKGNMSEETLRQVIEKHDSGTSIMICGIGEPTMHPDFAGFLNKITNKFDFVSIVSNLSHVTMEKIDAMLEGVNKIFISLDYFDSEKYQENKNGDLDQTLNNIKKLLEARNEKNSKAVIQINMLMQDDSEKEIRNAVEFFSPLLGKNDCIYTRMIKNLAGKVDVNPPSKSWNYLSEFKENLKKEGVGVEKFFVENWLDLLKLESEIPKRCACSHLDKYYLILWNGKVNACCVDFNANLIMGDINENSSEEIWTGREYISFRRANEKVDYKNYPICLNCDDWYKC